MKMKVNLDVSIRIKLFMVLSNKSLYIVTPM